MFLMNAKKSDTQAKVDQIVSTVEKEVIPEHSLCALAQAAARQLNEPVFALLYIQRHIFLQRIFFYFKEHHKIKKELLLINNEAENNMLNVIQEICHIKSINNAEGNECFQPLSDKEIMAELKNDIKALTAHDERLIKHWAAINRAYFPDTFTGAVKRVFDKIYDSGTLFYLVEHVLTHYSADKCKAELVDHPRIDIETVQRTLFTELIGFKQPSQAKAEQLQDALEPLREHQSISHALPDSVTPTTDALTAMGAIATAGTPALSVLAEVTSVHSRHSSNDGRLASQALGTTST